MSHNNLTISQKEADVNGNISLTTADINDLGAYSDGQTLLYDSTSSTWIGGPAPSGAGPNAITVGSGESADYDLLGNSFATGQIVNFYDADIRNNMPSYASVTYHPSQPDWVRYVVLQPGKYVLHATIGAKFSSSGVLAYCWRTTGNAVISNRASVTEATSYSGSANYALGWLTATSVTTVYVYVLESSGTSASQGTFPAENSTISIQRVA